MTSQPGPDRDQRRSRRPPTTSKATASHRSSRTTRTTPWASAQPTDDVEGHFRVPFTDETDEDVEGHLRVPFTDDETDEDVEGHLRVPFTDETDDDVEGHRLQLVATTAQRPADDRRAALLSAAGVVGQRPQHGLGFTGGDRPVLSDDPGE